PTHTATGVRAHDDIHLGGTFGWQPLSRFGTQAGLDWTPTDVKRGGQKVRYIHTHADVLLSPLRGPGWDFYGLLGFGFENYSVAGAGTDRFTRSVDTGAGLRLWASDHLAIRTEARNVLALARNQALRASQDND